MDSPGSSSQGRVEKRSKKPEQGDRPKRQRIATACTACRQRKAKCDGAQPCGSCIQAKLEGCTYPLTAKKVDPEYLQQLERRIEELSSAVNRSQNAGRSTTLPSIGILNDTDTTVDASEYSYQQASGEPSAGSIIDSSNTFPGHNGLRADPVSAARTGSGDAHKSLLTLIASPGVNTHFPDSSTRTLFDEVEGATRRILGGANGYSASRTQGRVPKTTAPSANGSDGEGMHMFTPSDSQQDLYSLPDRKLSDSLVGIYHDRIHPIFRILHWPSFIQQYEATFTAGGSADKHWLGLLNQVYAIACQIGGPEIEALQGAEAGLRFFQRSLAMMFPVVLQSRSLQALQTVLLMVQYLQSISQPSLCWTTLGHAVRFAQSQGLYSSSTLEHMNPIEAETRRRVWAGVVAMEATTAATLGLPPSLSARHCSSVEPTPVDDEYITVEGIQTQPANRPSVASFIQQTYRLYAIQLKILDRLYSPHSETGQDWPNSHDIVDYDRQLETFARNVPGHLQVTDVGVVLRGANQQLSMQANVLRARYLNAKILAHRPMLSHLCQRFQSDLHAVSTDLALDAALARASARICCSCAVEILGIVTANWKHGQSGAWWYSLYYVYSASLVILASFVVDAISNETSVPCVADLPQATKALKSARLYLSDKPEVLQGLMSPVVNQAAQESVRSCHAMLTGIMTTLAESAASPLNGNPGKGEYYAAIRTTLDMPLRDTAETPHHQNDPIDSNAMDSYTDFWTLLSHPRPPSPQPLEAVKNAQDSFLGFAGTQAYWPNDFSLDSWQWPTGDFALHSQTSAYDSAVHAAYTSKPAAPQHSVPTFYPSM